MGGVIRNEYELLSLRLSAQVSRSGASVGLEMWRGRQQISEDRLDAKALGLVERPSIRAYQGRRFEIDGPTLARVHALYEQNRHEPEEPLWLELHRGSSQLAFAPWEELLFPAVAGPILRLPSFVVPPRFLEGDRLSVAICASSPRAKTPFEVAPYVTDLVRTIQGCGVPGTDIHVFADDEAATRLRNTLGPSHGPHAVSLYDAGGAETFGLGASDRESLEDSAIRSPWLRWMLGVLRDQPIDAVHFACPGYFSDNRGALALARSPGLNTDRSWSHFVGGPELCAFLNQIGALSLGLSAPTDSAANLGLRLLVDELAQLRPGPIVHHQDWRTDVPTGRAYGFLFAKEHVPPHRDASLTLYVHPKLLEAFDQPHNWFAAPIDAKGMQRAFVLEKAPAPIEEFVSKGTRAEARPTPPTRWKRAMRLEVDQAMRQLSASDALGDDSAAVQRGAARALELIQSLLEKEET